MKRKTLLLTLLAGMTALIFSSYGSGPYAGGAGNRTGSAGTTADCTGSTCHSANTATTVAAVALFDNGIPVSLYTPGKTYRVRVSGSVQGTTRPRFGFQASCVKAADGSTQAGSFTLGGTTGIAIRSSTPQIVEHTSPRAGTLFSGNYIDTVSFNWTAPAAGFGKVRFYAVVNAVNYTGTSSGDAPNATTTEYDPAVTGVESVSGDNPFSVYPNPASSLLHVSTEGGANSLCVVDMSGRVIYVAHTTLSANNIDVQVSQLPVGYYQLLISAKGKTYSQPFLKN